MDDGAPLHFFQDRESPQPKARYPNYHYYNGYEYKVDEPPAPGVPRLAYCIKICYHIGTQKSIT